MKSAVVANSSDIHHHKAKEGQRRSAEWGLQSPLGRKLVLLTVLISSVFAMLMTMIQLYVEYQNDQNALVQSVVKIERALVPSLVESLWLLDDTLVQRQLEGFIQFQGVEYVHVENAGRIEIALGQETDRYTSRHAIPLERFSGGESSSLGTLVLSINHSDVVAHTIRRGALIFATNVLKTLVVAFIILRLYQMLIGRHIHYLADFATGFDPYSPRSSIKLDRDHGQADELTMLEEGINNWIAANHDYLDELRSSNEALAAGHKELADSNEKLKNANREQAEFTYAISHDLKSPTNTLGMLIRELIECGGLDEEAQGILSDMQSTNNRMGALVEDVLKYSRIVEERQASVSVDLSRTVREILKDLSADISASGAKIELEPLPRMLGDPMQLRMLLQNLISNAIKFRAPDRTPRVMISAKRDADGLILSVADNGIGIPPEHRERVFGLFQRLHARSSYEGSGLGLAICNRIIANHKGTISLSDGLDGGTTFTMKFRG